MAKLAAVPDPESVDLDALGGNEETCPFPGCGRRAEHGGEHGTAEEAALEDDALLPGPETPVTPRQVRSTRKRKAPANLGEPVLVTSGKLKLISVGKGIANVTVTLGFTLDVPIDIRDLLGEHAYAASFDGNYLGNGVFIKDAPLSVDVENNVHQTLKVHLPRFDEGADQIASYIAPLLSDAEAVGQSLLGLDESWRLNINVDVPGELRLFQMQQSFDLVTRAE